MATANVVQTSISGGHSNALAIQGDGAFLPKLDTASRLALTLGTPDKGLMVYDTTLTTICVWNGLVWEFISDNSNGWLSVSDFGAKGDGVTDDTAAIQAAITYVCPRGYGLLFPNGTYKITTSLKIPINTSGWSFFGPAQGAEIVQHTIGGVGEAIFEFAGGDISQFSISSLKLRWNDVNPQSGYKACGFLFNWDGVSSKFNGVYNFRIDNVFATFGFRFFSNYNTGLLTTDGVNIWGWHINRCTSNYMNGGMVRLSAAGTGGSPNCSVKDSYILGNTGGVNPELSAYVYAEPQFFCDSANGWQFSNVEINNVASSIYLFSFTGPGSVVEYNNCRVENVFFTLSASSGIHWSFGGIAANIVSFDYSRCVIKAAQTIILFKHSTTTADKLTIGTLSNNQNAGYPPVILQAGAACYLTGGTAGAIAVASDITACTSAIRYEASTPVYDGNRKWQRVAAFTNTYTPFASFVNTNNNYWEITSPGPTLTINAVVGAFEGQEYVFDIINSGGTLTAITWNAAYKQDGTTVPVGAGNRKTIRFIYVNSLYIQIGGTSLSF
jgi:hypothetical protein